MSPNPSQDLEPSPVADLSEFLFLLSNEFKAPVRHLDFFSERLKGQYSQGMDGEGLRYLAFLKTSARRIQKIVDKMQLIARVQRQSQKRGIEAKECLRVAANEAVKGEDCRPLNLSLNIEDDVVFPDTLFVTFFQEIFSNSQKFCIQKESRVAVDICNQRGGLQIKIEDNGIGLEGVRNAADIFKPFFRANGPDDYDGVGLGLSFCAKLIESRGGTFEAESTPDGTRLHFFIPDEGLLMEDDPS